jgi:hypothetical protein
LGIVVVGNEECRNREDDEEKERSRRKMRENVMA